MEKLSHPEKETCVTPPSTHYVMEKNATQRATQCQGHSRLKIKTEAPPSK